MRKTLGEIKSDLRDFFICPYCSLGHIFLKIVSSVSVQDLYYKLYEDMDTGICKICPYDVLRGKQVWKELVENGTGIITLTRECAGCGKSFEVEVRLIEGKILTHCFYGGKIRFGIGTWSSSKLEERDGELVWIKIHPWWRELYYHLIDLKKLMLHQYKDVEYWECPSCLKRGETH